jgi:hypothetical protein
MTGRPLYARIMGDRFAALPPMVRAIHTIDGESAAAGEGQVARGANPIARLLGALVGFPPSGAYDLFLAFAERGGREVWTRDFGGHLFASVLSAGPGVVVERFGPLSFHFELASLADGLDMRMRRWRAFGVPLPLALAPRTAAREWEADGRFRFDVRIGFPLIGEIVHYGGWLKPAPPALA